ncbi:MAG: hypothetical protein K2Q24_02440 [Chitinophagaceae bacterium]|nr:hypothetical protein [Chitinophagaceae bacterium]
MEQLQANFFNLLSKKIPANRKLSDELVTILGISKGEAYKKINTKSLLTIPQIKLLCDAFKVSFTIEGKENRSSANINFTPFHTGKIGVKDYINSLEHFLSNIALHNGKLSCATDDIPIFHLFQYPELTAFKLHFWQMRIIDHAPFKLNVNDWGPSILQPAARLHQLYQTIPSIEVWTKTSLLNTLDQIRYAAEAKIITDKTLGKLICSQLRSALSDIEVYAINRNKSNEKEVSFDWYFYDVIGTITYLAEMDGQLGTYIRFNTFNTIQEDNGPLCTEVKHWLHNLIQDATGFSGQGSVQRNKYLANAYEECDEMGDLF